METLSRASTSFKEKQRFGMEGVEQLKSRILCAFDNLEEQGGREMGLIGVLKRVNALYPISRRDMERLGRGAFGLALDQMVDDGVLKRVETPDMTKYGRLAVVFMRAAPSTKQK